MRPSLLSVSFSSLKFFSLSSLLSISFSFLKNVCVYKIYFESRKKMIQGINNLQIQLISLNLVHIRCSKLLKSASQDVK